MQPLPLHPLHTGVQPRCRIPNGTRIGEKPHKEFTHLSSHLRRSLRSQSEAVNGRLLDSVLRKALIPGSKHHAAIRSKKSQAQIQIQNQFMTSDMPLKCDSCAMTRYTSKCHHLKCFATTPYIILMMSPKQNTKLLCHVPQC